VVSRSANARIRLVVAAVALSFVLALVLAATGVVAPRGSGIALGASSTVTVLSGDVLVSHAGSDFVSLADGDIVGPGDVVRTQDGARAVITYFEGSTVEIEPGSELSIDEASSRPDGSTVILMTQNVGRTWHVVTHLLSGGSRYDVRTPNTTASVRGTAFQIDVADDQTVVTTTEGRVAASDVAKTAEVIVAPGLTSAIKKDQKPEEPKPAPEPERKVTVNMGTATSSLVVDPLGRSNGVKDGKVIIQTPGAQVTTINGQLVITMPNLPDGKIATVVEKKDRPAGSTVEVTTTVSERGREPVQTQESVRLTDEAKIVTGVEVRHGAPDAPPVIRPVDEPEKKDLPKDKVLATPHPERAAPVFRPAIPVVAPAVAESPKPSAATDRKPEDVRSPDPGQVKPEEKKPDDQGSQGTEAKKPQPGAAAPAKPEETNRSSGFVPVLPLAPGPATSAPPARPADSPKLAPSQSDDSKTAEPTRSSERTASPPAPPAPVAPAAPPALPAPGVGSRTAAPTDDAGAKDKDQKGGGQKTDAPSTPQPANAAPASGAPASAAPANVPAVPANVPAAPAAAPSAPQNSGANQPIVPAAPAAPVIPSPATPSTPNAPAVVPAAPAIVTPPPTPAPTDKSDKGNSDKGNSDKKNH